MHVVITGEKKLSYYELLFIADEQMSMTERGVYRHDCLPCMMGVKGEVTRL